MYINARPPGGVLRLSLQGVRRLDAGFAGEAIVEVIRQYRSARPICLVGAGDEDILGNIAAAARERKTPVTVWRAGSAQILGGPRTRTAQDALAFALARPSVRAAEYAESAGISITNASSRLHRLWAAGCLLRDATTAPSGGTEYVYRPIG